MFKPIAERIKLMKEKLESDEGKRDPSFVAYVIYYWPETREFNLNGLAHMLYSEEYGCSVNDVKGLIDLIEGRAFPNGKDEQNA